MDILIAGYGYVGKALGQKLLSAGHRVYAIKRSPFSNKHISGIITDLSKPPLAKLPQVDAVFYLLSADQYSQQAYQSAYVKAQSNLINALIAENKQPKHWVFASSSHVYNENHGNWVNEQTPCNPNHFAGKILLKAENLSTALNCPTTILRFSGIYGYDRSRIIEDIISNQVSERWFSNDYANRIAIEDVVSILLHSLSLQDKNSCLIASDGNPFVYKTMLKKLTQTLKQDLPSCKKTSTTRVLSNKRLSNQKLLNTGYRFIVPVFDPLRYHKDKA